MDLWRKIDGEEFKREFTAMRERLFDPRHWENGGRPFVDGDWQIVPIPSCPFYVDQPGVERPKNFPPIEPYFANYFEPLYLTWEEFGIDEVVVTRRAMAGSHCEPSGVIGFDFAWGFGEKGEEHRLVRPTATAFDAVEFGQLGMANYTIFDRDGQWGVVVDDDEYEFSLLGGTTFFMEAFFRVLGGARNACAWFSFFLLSKGGGFWPEGSESDLRYLKSLYKQAGWPFPNRWGCYDEEEIDWSWMMDDEGFPET